MLIKQLELKSIKSYDNSGPIQFTQGVNAITGSNGAGKSTILEAIGLALFDVRSHTHKNFIRDGENNGEIVVTFIDSLDEREYQAVRPVGSGTPYIFDPEIKRKIVSGKDDYFYWLKEHMNVPATASLHALFSDAVGVPQGSLTAAFQESPGPRKNKFDPLLQVADYELTWTQLRSSLTHLKNQIHSQELGITNLGVKLERLPVIKDEEKRLLQSIKQDEEELKKVIDDLEGVNEKKSILDELERQIQNLKHQIERLESQLSALSSQLKDAEISLEEAEKAKSIVEEVEASHQAYKEAQSALEELDEQRSKRDEIKARLAESKQNVALIQQQIKRLETELQKISDAEKVVDQLKPKVDEQKELENQLKELEKSEAELENARKRESEEKDRYNNLLRERDEVEAQLQRLNEIESGIQSLEEQQNTLIEREASIKTYLTQAGTQRAQLIERLKLLEQTEGAQCPVCQQSLDEAQVNDLELHYREELEGIAKEEEKGFNESAEIGSTLQGVGEKRKALQAERQTLPSRARESELEDEIKKQEANLKKWQEGVEELSNVPGQLSRIKEKLQEIGNPKGQYAIHKARADERSHAEEELTRAKNNLESAIEEQFEAEELLKPFANLDDELSIQKENMEKHKEDHRRFLVNIKIAEKLTDRKAKVVELQNEIEVAEEGKSKLINDFVDLDKLYNVEEHQKVIKGYQELSSKKAALKERTALNKESLVKTRKEIELLEPLKKKLEEAKGEFEFSKRIYDVLSFVRTVIRDAGPHITKQLVSIISSEADRIFGDIMNDYTSRLNWSEDYEITIEQKGIQREFSQLSGGEKMAAALAVRLALLREMSDIRIAFFDEPTAHLDAERRVNLSEQITQIKGFKQLFIISHDDTFERDIYHVLHISKDNGASQVEVGFHAASS